MKSRLRLAALITATAVLTGCLTACTDEQTNAADGQAENNGGQQNRLESSAPRYADSLFSLNCDMEESFDPYKTGSAANLELAQLMYEGLFAVNDDFSFENVLCQDYSTADGKVYRLNIKSGITMHDGSELRPEDVALSIAAARTSDNYSTRLSIINAAYVIEGCVYIELSRPDYNLPLLLDIPIVRASENEAELPLGTGPYRFVDAGEYKYLKAFEGHREFADLPLERIYLKAYNGAELVNAFDAGFVDLVTSSKADIAYLEYSGNIEKRSRDTTVLYFLGVNSRCSFLSDSDRRVLFSSMIDRQILAENVIDALPTTIPLHPKAYFYSPDYDSFTIRSQDIEAAKIQYMVEDYDGDGLLEYMDREKNSVEEIELKLIVNKENPSKVDAARELSRMLGEQGIKINVTPLSWSSYIQALKNADYDLYYGEVMLTADFDLTQLLCYGGSANYGLYDPQLQSLIYDFNASGEEGKTDAAASLYGYIAEKLPVISLMFEMETVYTHRETVSGMKPTIHNIFNDIASWSICLE